MINNKKALSVALSAIACMVLAACGSKATSSPAASSAAKSSTGASSTTTSSATPSSAAASSATPSSAAASSVAGLKLTVWCPGTDTEVTNTIIANFKTANAAKYGNADISILGNVGEGDVFKTYKTDLAAGADVACTADDNIGSCVDGEYLDSFSATEVAAAVASDGQNAVDYGTVDGTTYGLPYRGDNGYVLYYDSAKITDAQTATLEGLVAACKSASLKMYLNVTTAWYAPTVLWAGGGFNRVNAGVIESNFAEDGPVAAEQALADLWAANSSTFVDSSDTAKIDAALKDGTFGACVLWNHYADAVKLCSTLKAVKLPTIAVGGVAKQLKTFFGYKYITVKKGLTDNKELAHDFAAFMANKDSQSARISLSEGPTNLTLAGSDAVKAIPHLAALAVMNGLGATVPQGPTVTDSFWTPAAIPGNIMVTSAPNWGTYGDGLTGAKACLTAVVTSDGWSAVAA
jgi:spermidine/putrescine-binding protein